MFFALVPLVISVTLIVAAYTFSIGAFALIGCLYALISMLFAALEIERLRQRDNAPWNQLAEEARHVSRH